MLRRNFLTKVSGLGALIATGTTVQGATNSPETVKFAEVAVRCDLSSSQRLRGDIDYVEVDTPVDYAVKSGVLHVTSPDIYDAIYDDQQDIVTNQELQGESAKTSLPTRLAGDNRPAQVAVVENMVEFPALSASYKGADVEMSIEGKIRRIEPKGRFTTQATPIEVAVKTVEPTDELVDAEIPRWKRANKMIERYESITAVPYVSVVNHGTLEVATHF